MPPVSPQMQSPGAGGGMDQAKSMFDSGFTQMAYNVLVSKLPNVANDVITFKVLSSDSEKGAGVGAFVILRNGQTFYVPVVLAENNIKPLDVLYFKDLNVFLPLSKEWLEELDKRALGDLGHGVRTPETLNTDMDIRQTVVPPTTGRYSYASENAYRVIDEARNQSNEPKLAFLELLSKSSNRVKKAYAQLLETNHQLLKNAVYYYGEPALLDAVKCSTEKVADYGAKMARSGGLYIADKSTKPSEYKDVFGDASPLAFQGVSMKGYFAKDERKDLKKALTVQLDLWLVEPKTSGPYQFWHKDGTIGKALIFANPISLYREEGHRIPPRNIRFRTHVEAPAVPALHPGGHYRIPGVDGTRDEHFCDHFVGITEDGELLTTHKMIAKAVTMADLEGSKVYQKTVADVAAAGPRKGQRGVFAARRGHTFIATEPVEIETVSEVNGAKHYVIDGGLRTLVQDPKAGGSKLLIPRHGQFVHLPGDFHFIPATKGRITAEDVITNPKDVMRWVMDGVDKSEADKVLVKKAYHGFTLGSRPTAELDFVSALCKLATDAHISVADAEAALKTADEKGKCEFYVFDAKQHEKFAAFVKVADAAPQAQPQQGQDPAADAMAQVPNAQAMAPQGPSPVDMAVAEQMQSIQGQMQALTQMQQLMQNLQMRANQIATGGAAANPAAAAAAMGGPMDPSMMGAGAPVQGMGGQPQDPNAQQQGQPAPGGAPGMPPQQGQAPQGQPGTQLPPGQDPNAQAQQPPSAMMNADDGSVDSLMSQVNPQFANQAAQLDDKGVFDAASLSMMAQSPALKDMVAAYLPNLEKAADNLGRVLLTLWMDESEIKENIGNEAFIGLETNLRTTFKGLGDAILKLNNTKTVIPDQNSSLVRE